MGKAKMRTGRNVKLQSAFRSDVMAKLDSGGHPSQPHRGLEK